MSQCGIRIAPLHVALHLGLVAFQLHEFSVTYMGPVEVVR